MAATKFEKLGPHHIRITCGSGKFIHEIRLNEETKELEFNDYFPNQEPEDDTEGEGEGARGKRGKAKPASSIFDQL